MKFVLLCHGAIASMRTGGFPAIDEPLEADADSFKRFARVVSSPGAAARQTAAALHPEPLALAALGDIDHGAWSGRSFADVHAEAPERFEAWLARPWDGVPGGESFAQVCARVDAWVGEVEDGPTLAVVTHPTIVRAILTVTIGIPAEAVMQVDVAPLAAATLSRHRGWRLQRLGERFA